MKEVLTLALEALEESKTNNDTMEFHDRKNKAITAIKEALAQPEQEPVAQYIGEAYEGSLVQLYDDVKKGTNFYTTPPHRKPLPPKSPCEMTQAEGKMFKLGWLECEAAHGIKEKNT